MRQFLSIFRFEFNNIVRTKIFMVLTVVLMLVIGVVLSFPRFSSGEKEEAVDVERPVIAVLDEAGGEATVQFLSAAMPQRRFVAAAGSEESIREKVEVGEYEGAILVEGPLKYRYVVNNLSMMDDTPYQLDEIMLQKYRMEAMRSAGLTGAQAGEIMGAAVEREMVQLGKDQFNSFIYTYVLMFALYMAIIVYGQLVATSVASEKSSRAMELLITSAKPVNLMFGKVLGAGLAGLFQLFLVFGSSFLFYNVNKEYWAGNPIVDSIFGMPIEMLFYTLLFFLLGYLIYSFLYGALGSLASRSEDINTLTMPVTFLFIIAFVIVMVSMGTGDVDSGLMVAASFIPFTSPMAMFTRIAMGNVSALSVVLSVAILLATTVAIGYLSAGIYRVGVLLYGKPPRLGELVKMLRASRHERKERRGA